MIIEGGSGIGMAGGISFFIIVPELDKDIISLFHLRNDFLPAAFTDKTSGTSTIGSMIIYPDILGEESGKYHSPATFGISSVQFLIGHSRISYHKDSYDRFIRTKCGTEDKGCYQ